MTTFSKLTTRLYLLLSFTIALGFISCESDVTLQVENGESKLFAYSEFSPEDKITVYVNTAVGINTDDDFYFPDQNGAEVVLYQDGVELEDPGFRYIRSKKAFVSQGSFRPTPGIVYGLGVSLKERNDIKSIYGETKIPEPDSVRQISLNHLTETQFSLSLDLQNSSNQFLLVDASLHKTKTGVANLEVLDIHRSGATAIIVNNGSFLIKKEGLESNVTIELGSDIETTGGTIELIVRTITKEAYDYHKSISLQSASQNISFAEPVINQTNFNNGLGLFSGYSRSVTNIQL